MIRAGMNAEVHRQAGAADESGAGSILGVAIIAALVAAALLVAPLGAVLGAQARTRAAADAAALAAADVAIGLRPGAPCDSAADLATAGGVELSGCVVDGVIVTVQVRVGVGPWRVRSSATAGPPG